MKRTGPKRALELLAALGLGCAALISTAGSKDRYHFGVDYFGDNRKVKVFEALFDFNKELSDKTNLSLHEKVDAISSASVSCSVCHKSTKSLARNEIVLGGTHALGNTTLGASYYDSRELDYSSDALSLSVAQKLRQENTTFSVGYTRSFDRPKPHGWRRLLDDEGEDEGEEKERKRRGKANEGGGGSVFRDFIFSPGQVVPKKVPDLDVNTLSVGWTQVLGQRTLAQFNYEFTSLQGYQSDTYHLLSIDGVDRFEKHPDSRHNNVFSMRLKQSLSSVSTAGVNYRFYTDDWGVHSNTIGLEFFRYLRGKDFLLKLNYRFYTQSAADFSRNQYSSTDRFITIDDRLQSFETHFFGAKLTLPEMAFHTASGSVKHFRLSLRYDYYTGDPSLVGVVSSGRRARGSSSDLSANIIQLEVESPF